MNVKQYKTLIFDCDGVILNSNKIKTQVFYEATKHFGHESAQALVNYHIQNGGISRYAKFQYFFTDILKQEIHQPTLNDLLTRFANGVKDGLMSCEVAEGLAELRKKTEHARWLVASGGDQFELREVFALRGLDRYFDGGIYGSPDTKEKILEREMKSLNINKPGLFLGDSKYDLHAASQAGLDFIFVSNWTELKDWQNFCFSNKLISIDALESMAK